MPTPTQELEDRINVIEDKLSIYDLIAAHPPSADTGDAEYTQAVYTEDAVFYRGPDIEGARGLPALTNLFRRPEHGQAIAGGLAHFCSLPLIELRDNEAFVTSYLLLLYLNHDGKVHNLPNHGPSQGYLVHRVVVNRWQLVKVAGNWKIKSRLILPADGSREHLSLLTQGLASVLAERANATNLEEVPL